MSNVLKVLELSRDKIVNVGWCQHLSRKFADQDATIRQDESKIVGYCLMGALFYSEDELNLGAEYSQRAYEACADVIGGNLIDWNDTVGRTKEEVLDVINKAIQDLEK